MNKNYIKSMHQMLKEKYKCADHNVGQLSVIETLVQNIESYQETVFKIVL